MTNILPCCTSGAFCIIVHGAAGCQRFFEEILRNTLNLKKDDFVVIYPAEISNRKNQEWLLKCIKDLIIKYPHIHLLLPGKDSLNGKIQNLANNLKLNNNVHFLGFRKDIPKLLKISDIAISSSKQEGLPVNIMEAMFIGLPIIVTNCRGNRDLIKNNVNGFIVEQEDNNNFINKIEELYNNKALRKEFGKNNKKDIKKYFLKNILKDMIAIYEESNHENEN